MRPANRVWSTRRTRRVLIAGEVDLGDQQLGAPAQAPVGRRRSLFHSRSPASASASRAPGTASTNGPNVVSNRRSRWPLRWPLKTRTSLVSTPAEGRLELLLQELLDEPAHLATHRVFQRVEPVGVQTGQWRRRSGWRSFVHGVGSSLARPSEPTPPSEISTTFATRPRRLGSSTLIGLQIGLLSLA